MESLGELPKWKENEKKKLRSRICLIKKQNKPARYISLQEQIKANQVSSELLEIEWNYLIIQELLKIEAKTNHSLAHNFAGSKQSEQNFSKRRKQSKTKLLSQKTSQEQSDNKHNFSGSKQNKPSYSFSYQDGCL